MNIFDKRQGIKMPIHKKRVTRSYRKGRRFRPQQIACYDKNDRPIIKTIIHQMY